MVGGFGVGFYFNVELFGVIFVIVFFFGFVMFFLIKLI